MDSETTSRIEATLAETDSVVPVRRTDKRLSETEEKVYLATQLRLMWWRFKKNCLAIVGLVILGLYLFIAVFAEFIAPVPVEFRDPRYVLGPPQQVHFVDSEGNFHTRPFIYGMKTERDPVTLGAVTKEDTSQIRPLSLFVEGEPYRLCGLWTTNIHLFGLEERGGIHLFGTDQLGRDIFSRLMYATRTSLSVGVYGVLISFTLGTLLGGIAGFFGGWTDAIIQRVSEFMRSIPRYPLWMALASALPRQWSAQQVYITVTIILGFLGWTQLARRVRSKLLSTRQEDFVMAAKLAGSTNMRIIWRHLLPSILSYLIVHLTMQFPSMILGETTLSFVGLGLRPPVVSWGVLLQAGQSVQAIAKYPWLLTPVALVILAVLAFSFVGDGARDAADPYGK